MFYDSQKTLLGFDDRIIVLVGVLVNTHTVMAMYYTDSFLNVDRTSYFIKWTGEFLLVLILWLVMRFLYLKLIKQYRGILNFKKRWAIIPLFLLPYFGICLLHFNYVQPYFDWNYPEFEEPSTFAQMVTGVIIFFLDISIYEGLHFFAEAKDNEIKQEQLRKEKLGAELNSLKNNLSPHFLYNSLNTLMFYIDSDPEAAKEYVICLSKLFKNFSENSERELISIRKELQAAELYGYLIKKRFQENLTINFEICPLLYDKKIVPFSIQAAIEDAVAKNTITKSKPLTINILNNGEYIEVHNTNQPKITFNTYNSETIKNIINSYNIRSKKRVVVEEKPNNFVVRLPILTFSDLNTSNIN